ncbi:MAG TPA: O-antigen ligase family protein [Bryobacteraceae bacterium]
MAAGADALASPREWRGRTTALGIGLCAGLVPLSLSWLNAPSPAIWIPVALLLCAPLAWYAFTRTRKWPLLFCATAILLPPVPFPIGDSGAHASVVVAGLGMLAGLACLRSWRIRKSPLNLALAALTGAFAFSLGFAILYSGWVVAAGSAVRLFLFCTGIYVYFAASQGPCVESRTEARTTTRWIFAVAAAAALFGCIDFFYQLPAPAGFGAQFIWLDTGVFRRAQGLFYDASALGNFCAFFLVGGVVALAQSRKRRVMPTSVACGAVMLFLAALLVSYSRGSLLTAAIGCAALAILERRRWANGRTYLVFGLVAVTAVAFLIAYPKFALAYLARFNSIASVSPDAALSGRLASWSAIGGFIAEHPLQTLLGIGYKTLPYTTHFGRPVIADNMYLSVLVETGVFGLLALLAVNLGIVRASARAARSGSFFGRWMLCFWLGEMFQMLTGDVLTFWRVLPVYFWVLAQAVLDQAARERDSIEDSGGRSI